MRKKRILTAAMVAGALCAMHANAQNQQTATGGNLWGFAFGDYAWVAHGDSAGRGNGWLQYKGLGAAGNTANQNAVEIRRAYLGYDYVINSKFSANALLAYEGDQDVNGNRTVYLKTFNFTWKNIFPNSNLSVGQMFTPSFVTPYNTEPEWGYRSVERTLVDMRKIDAATDMGIALYGKIATLKCSDTGKAPTIIGYEVMLGDNTANSPVPGFTTTLAATPMNNTTDKLKKWRGNFYVNTLNNMLTVGTYFDYYNVQGEPYPLNIYTLKGYAFFSTKWFSVGGEYAMQSGKNYQVAKDNVAGALNDTTASAAAGWSVYAHGDILKNKLAWFARVDGYNPDVNYSKNSTYKASLVKANNYTELFATAGFDWTPTPDKKVHIMPNIWYDAINNRNDASGKNKTDYYLVPRITFFYIFKK